MRAIAPFFVLAAMGCGIVAVTPRPASAADFGTPGEFLGQGRPVYGAGADAYGEPPYERSRPARRVTRSSDYAGSDWGLGKPSFYGMAPRPDWGRSSLD